MGSLQNNTSKLLIVSGASGTGKTTLCKLLVAEHPECQISISHTTRVARNYETNHKHYHFVSKKEFQTLISNDQFVEYAEVFGNYYGTAKTNIETALKEGKTLVFDIDIQGAFNIQKHHPQDSISIFLLPPSINELEKRLKNRASDDPETIRKRLKHSIFELENCLKYDYVFLNNDLESCYSMLVQVIQGEKLDDNQNRKLVNQLIEQGKSKNF